MALFLKWLLFWMEREKDGGREVDLEWKSKREGREVGRGGEKWRYRQNVGCEKDVEMKEGNVTVEEPESSLNLVCMLLSESVVHFTCDWFRTHTSLLLPWCTCGLRNWPCAYSLHVSRIKFKCQLSPSGCKWGKENVMERLCTCVSLGSVAFRRRSHLKPFKVSGIHCQWVSSSAYRSVRGGSAGLIGCDDDYALNCVGCSYSRVMSPPGVWSFFTYRSLHVSGVLRPGGTSLSSSSLILYLLLREDWFWLFYFLGYTPPSHCVPLCPLLNLSSIPLGCLLFPPSVSWLLFEPLFHSFFSLVFLALFHQTIVRLYPAPLPSTSCWLFIFFCFQFCLYCCFPPLRLAAPSSHPDRPRCLMTLRRGWGQPVRFWCYDWLDLSVVVFCPCRNGPREAVGSQRRRRRQEGHEGQVQSCVSKLLMALLQAPGHTSFSCGHRITPLTRVNIGQRKYLVVVSCCDWSVGGCCSLSVQSWLEL